MTPIVINKRFAARVGFVLLLTFGATVHQSSLQSWQADIASTQAKANSNKDSEQKSRERVKSLSSESSIALDRVKSGCEPIVLTANNRPVRLQANSRVFDPQTFPASPKTPRFDKSGNPINGVQSLPEGLMVCNQFGDTAIVGFEGALTEIKRVQKSQLSEFLKYFKDAK